uniref:Uncharacterized protein n=1 Tax=Arundo donax TaxID=35708 RepID=A0A0A9HVF9_ARUDO
MMASRASSTMEGP